MFDDNFTYFLHIFDKCFDNYAQSLLLGGSVVCEHRVGNDHSAISNKKHSTKVSTVIFKHDFGDGYSSIIYQNHSTTKLAEKYSHKTARSALIPTSQLSRASRTLLLLWY